MTPPLMLPPEPYDRDYITTRRCEVTDAATTPADCGLRGLALLDAAINRIEALDVDESARYTAAGWYQGSWRCETGMCLAGHIAEMAGGRWAYGPDHEDASLLLPATEGGEEEYVSARAMRLLGIDPDDWLALQIFNGANTLDTIRACRDAMAEAGQLR